MSRRITITWSDDYSSITLNDANGVRQDFTVCQEFGMVKVLASLPTEQHNLVMNFCQAMVDAGRNNNPRRLTEW